MMYIESVLFKNGLSLMQMSSSEFQNVVFDRKDCPDIFQSK